MSLKKCAAENIYRMDGTSAWIFADDADIWIIKSETGLTISVWPNADNSQPIESIYLTWNKIKEGKAQ